MNNDPDLSTTIAQLGNTTQINNGRIVDITCSNNSGNILVSYSAPGSDTGTRNIRLNINNRTLVLNTFGQRICVCCLQRGMLINAIISSAMTRSIPPQSNAFLINVLRNPSFPIPPNFPFPPQRPTPPQGPSDVTTGRIILIDFDNHYIITENPNDINDQTRFNITNSTSITNRFGAPIQFNSLRTNQLARIRHANFQTPSIPPQTTAFQIQLL